MRLGYLSLFALICFTVRAQEWREVHFESGLIRYFVGVGSIACRDERGQEKGRIHYTYYHQKDDPSRPITFVFNGGPGASSIYLHFGAFGPKRLASISEGQTQFPPYRWIDNLDSILDLTDLIFIDPIGTGFSRAEER